MTSRDAEAGSTVVMHLLGGLRQKLIVSMVLRFVHRGPYRTLCITPAMRVRVQNGMICPPTLRVVCPRHTQAEQKNDWEIEIPWVMGLIGTRSVSKQIPGIREIKAKNRERIRRGIVAVNALDADVLELSHHGGLGLCDAGTLWPDILEYD